MSSNPFEPLPQDENDWQLDPQSQALTPIPSLTSTPEVSNEDIGQVFQAAAEYFRAAPWELLSDTQPLALHFDPPSKQGFMQLMGYAGVQYGLLFYWNWEDLLHTYQAAQDPLEGVPPEGWMSFTFESRDMLPASDLEAIRAHHWEIADPNAYPLPLTYGVDDLQRPTRLELVCYEAALRAIPLFVREALKPDDQDDFHGAEAQYSVDTFDGRVAVTVRYPAGEIPEALLADPAAGFIPLFDQSPDFSSEEDEDDDLRYEGVVAGGTMKQHSLVLEFQTQSDPDLQKAQRLVEAAYREQDPARRVALAEQALEASPNCSEAYFLLAEEVETVEEAYDLYQQAMQVAERMLGIKAIEQGAGQLWRWREARPYLRARQELAECLAQIGQPQEALAHYYELLRLNPQDNQGIRYASLALHMALNDDQKALALLEAYPQESFAAWPYTHALLAFRASGNSRHAQAALAEALAHNPYVKDYLTGRKALPSELPEYIGFGDESEAIHYVSEHYPNWWGTPGAIAWLKAAAEI